MAGINLASGFNRTSASPLDLYATVADTSARDAIPSGVRFEGMVVYVEADETNYQLIGGILDANWSSESFGGGDIAGDNVTLDNTGTDFLAENAQEFFQEQDLANFGFETDISNLNTTKANGPASAVQETIATYADTSGKVLKATDVTLLGGNFNRASGNISFDPEVRFQKATAHSSADKTTAGSNVVLTGITTKIVRLTAPGTLVSIDGIELQDNGQELILVNMTGVDVIINNKTGGDNSQWINTGTDTFITLKNRCTLTLYYDVGELNWLVVGAPAELGVSNLDVVFQDDFEKSLASAYTLVGATLSASSPLHGLKSMLITSDSTINQSFKRVYAVSERFRGQAASIKLAIKSNATKGNLTLNIYDETNAANIVASEQLSFTPGSNSTAFVNFTIPATCASISYTFIALPEAGSPVTRVDDVVMFSSAFQLPTSGLVQDGDSEIFAYDSFGGTAGFGTTTFTSKYVRRFANFTSRGSDITVTTTTTDGSVFTANSDGIYHANFTDESELVADGVMYLYVDTTLKLQERIGAESGEYDGSMSWSGYLLKGQSIRFLSSSNNLNANTGPMRATVAKQGSLKQVSVNKNSKITIPTSEVRFEGASSRGSTATGVIKFDNITKLKGDAFEIVSNGVDATYVKMKRAGRLTITGAVQYSTSAGSVLSRNQTVLTNYPTVSNENLSSDIGAITEVSWTGDVSINDTFRLSSTVSPLASINNQINFSFQEQEIQVSVNNILPAYSESDILFKGASNAGQSVTASVTDIPFTATGVDTRSGWSGSAYTVKETGLYDISGSVYTNANIASPFLFLYVNGVNYKTIGLQAGSINVVPFQITESFTAGQVLSIRHGTGATLAASTIYHWINISQVGKKNVTGVDVTSFVNLPRTVNSDWVDAGLIASDFSGLTVTTISAQSKREGGDLLLRGTVYVSAAAGSEARVALKHQGTLLTSANGSRLPTIQNCGTGIASFDVTAGFINTVPYLCEPSVTYFTVQSPSTRAVLTKANGNAFQTAGYSLAFNVRIPIKGWEIEENNIVTSVESFSTDTASLVYASSATYTLATLANAPVGTFITFYWGANAGVKTQSTTAPTQSIASMNSEGLRLYGRTNYTVANSPNTPNTFAIQIGKGHKGFNVSGYNGAGKTNPSNLDLIVFGTTYRGLAYQAYDEKTGILMVDAGQDNGPAQTGWSFYGQDDTVSSSTYLVINASKNPALTGVQIYKSNKDVEVTDAAKGVVLTAPNGTRYRGTINNSGVLAWTAI